MNIGDQINLMEVVHYGSGISLEQGPFGYVREVLPNGKVRVAEEMRTDINEAVVADTVLLIGERADQLPHEQKYIAVAVVTVAERNSKRCFDLAGLCTSEPSTC